MNERIEKLQENIVPAAGQTFVPFMEPEEARSGLRVLFLGNSFTYHRPRPEIGWNRSCGMAASCLDKDYVHQLMKLIRQKDPDATFAIHSTSFLIERNLDTFTTARFRESLEWKPDVVILFFGENVPKEDPQLPAVFGQACQALRRYLGGHARFFWVGGFYLRPELDAQKKAAAAAFDDDYITLEDIALREDYHGEFNHPNDEGMEAIARRMWECMENRL